MILFIDVDGTLVDYSNNLPESAVNAIKRARKNGHKVYICTGRSKAEVYAPIWDIGIDGMIGGNGSYVEAAGKVIMHKTLSLLDTTRIVDYLYSKGLEFYIESNSGLFASKAFESRGERAVREYSRLKGRNAKLTVKEAFPDMIFGASPYIEDANKISYVLNSYNDYITVKEAFPEFQHGTWGGAGETALFGDVGVKDITKSHAISVLLEHIGALSEDTIAFGDAKIDLSMFECCGYSVAMGNGGPEVKQAADYITTDVDNDGLKNAFEYLKLI